MNNFTSDANEIIKFVQRNLIDTYTDDSSRVQKILKTVIITADGSIYPMNRTSAGRPLYVKDKRLRQSSISTGFKFKHTNGKFEETVRSHNDSLEIYATESSQTRVLDHIITLYYEEGIPISVDKRMSEQKKIEVVLRQNQYKYRNKTSYPKAKGIMIDTNDNIYPLHLGVIRRVSRLELYNTPSSDFKIRTAKLNPAPMRFDGRFNTAPEIIKNHNETVYEQCKRTLELIVERKDFIINLRSRIKSGAFRTPYSITEEEIMDIKSKLSEINLNVGRELHSVWNGTRNSHRFILEKIDNYINLITDVDIILDHLVSGGPNKIINMSSVKFQKLTNHIPIIKNIKVF